VLGMLLLVGGNGPVVWAAQRVPSGLTSLLVAMTPLWMMAIEALRTRTLPRPLPAFGVVAGLVGLALLVGGEGGQGADRADPLAALVLVGASLSWSLGSILARSRPPASPLQATGMQMLVGGALLFVLGVAEGELVAFTWASVTPRSWWALVYLSLVGSVFGYSAYTYLLRHATAAAASTYAYVNPVVALALGAAFAGEVVTSRTLVAAGIIVASVALVVSAKK
jgi:drug/metabolite transporter (DMT)-like permease